MKDTFGIGLRVDLLRIRLSGWQAVWEFKLSKQYDFRVIFEFEIDLIFELFILLELSQDETSVFKIQL